MSSWLDRLARKTAAAEASVPNGDEGFSRREALRRAGIIGAAVVAVPVMDSVLSPAFASTSGGGGGTCTSPSDPSAMCGGKDKKNCPRCSFGKVCTDNQDCISKACVQPHGGRGTCGPSPDGGDCYENNDCRKGSTCVGYKSNHVGICQPKPKHDVAKGGACTTDGNCTGDLVCLNGKCADKPKNGQ